MISCKRTLGWTLCWMVASAAVTAEEPGAAAAPAPDSAAVSAAPATPPAAAAVTAAPEPAAAAPASESAPAPAAEAAAAPAGEAAAAPVAESMPAAESAPAAMAETPPAQPQLGPVGYDSQGHQGRIHTVIKGNTLWAISNMYLATPWVWPSIWKDNGEIKNPHRIYPGDRIWITPSEMRRISPDEADRMLANVPAAPAPAPIEDAVPGMEPRAAAPARTVKVSARETAGLISPAMYEASASVVSRVPERLLMTQEDRVYIGLGEEEVKAGDEFTLFRTNEKVLDPDTGSLLGYHVDFLGWVKVEETSPETSLARIHMSTGEIEEGDRVLPREPMPQQIEVKPTPEGIEGKITFFPGRRVLMGMQDFVYLNRGTLDGLEVGSPLEVYRAGYPAREETRDENVAVPPRVIAKMLVVRTEEQTAVAMVTSTTTELVLGDKFRSESLPQQAPAQQAQAQ
jgi:LysM domain